MAYMGRVNKDWKLYKARRGKIHRVKKDDSTRLECGRRLNWNYSQMYATNVRITENNIRDFCQRCFKEEKRVSNMLTSVLPDELFEI